MATLHRPPARVPGRPALRVGPFSVVRRPRTVVVLVVAAALLVIGVALDVGRGEYPIGVPDVLAALLGGGDPGQRFIVLELRLPRSLTGALVGAALAVAGALTQAVARNPLASPDVVGFTAGASAAAVFVIVLGGGFGAVGGFLAAAGVPLAALAGSLVTAMLIYALAWRNGVVGLRLVLIGIAVNAILFALVQWLLVLAQVNDAARAYRWLNGSLSGAAWGDVVPVSIALVVLVPAALLLAHVLGGLQFGDDTALALGIGVNRARSALILVAVGLTAVATSAAGPVEFVALVAPQIAQRLVGAARPPIAASLLIGATLTVFSDLVARTAFGIELPVGVVTAVLGAPYLLFLIARPGREARA